MVMKCVVCLSWGVRKYNRYKRILYYNSSLYVCVGGGGVFKGETKLKIVQDVCTSLSPGGRSLSVFFISSKGINLLLSSKGVLHERAFVIAHMCMKLCAQPLKVCNYFLCYIVCVCVCVCCMCSMNVLYINGCIQLAATQNTYRQSTKTP